MPDPLWIMIAGPYRTGAVTEEERKANLAQLNRAALEVFHKGHVPIIGVNAAFPLTQVASPDAFDPIMESVSLALAERCDAVLRIGGPSRGADDEVARVRAHGGTVFTEVDQVPEAGSRSRTPVAMLHHASLPVRDLERAAALYDAALGALGYRRVAVAPGFVGYGWEDGKDKFAIKQADDVQAAGPRFHLAFAAPSPADVDAFHAAATTHGARDDGPPGKRPHYGPHYYAAFVVDLDGHRIEAVHNAPVESE